MLTNGNIIDIALLTQGARDLTVLTSKLEADELYGDEPLSYVMYDALKAFAQNSFGESLIAASGEHVIGIDADGEYTQTVEAAESYLTGKYDGICPVMLDDPVEIGDVLTFFVPTIEFRVCDVLGVARVREARRTSAASFVKCFRKVAMPLVVQTPTIYALS